MQFKVILIVRFRPQYIFFHCLQHDLYMLKNSNPIKQPTFTLILMIVNNY